MNFQASIHKTEKNYKSALTQKRPHPPYSSLRQAAQQQLTTKKGRGERSEKGDAFYLSS